MIVSEVTATDVAQKVKLIIPKGTIVKNRFDQMVSSISIKQSGQSLAAGLDSRVISLCYDIQPSDTTFDPSATLVFIFTDSELPEEISENSLYIALWEPVAGEWIDLGGDIDPAAHVVSVPVQHLSTYALMAHTRPATFELSDFTLSSPEVGLGEGITFSVLVTNSGDLTGNYGVSLKLDDTVVETKTITLDGRDSETVYFNTRPATAGEHKASIGDLSATFFVNGARAPAAFVTNNLAVSPTEITLGGGVVISVLVSNIGNSPGTYNTILRIDNTEVQAREVELASGESQEVSFNITPETVGQHVVTIGGAQVTYIVQAPLPGSTGESVNTGAKISSFSATPVYDPETGRLISTRMEYQLDRLQEQLAEIKLILKIFYEGEPLEEIPLLSLTQLQSDGYSGSLVYIPSAGWKTGLYSFQAELYEGENSIQSTEPQPFTVTPQDIARVVSWKTLGIVIGAALIVTAVILAIVLVRRREMLHGYYGDK
jgi:hypothetical protein